MCKKIVIAGCLLAASISQAGEYQFEMGLDYTETDVDSGTEEDSHTVSGRYYLSPVDDSKGPLAEAAFLQRASHIDLSYQKINWENDAILNPSSRRNANGGSVGATYIFKDSGWLLSADYSDGKQDAGTYDEDQYGYNVAVGKYVAENTLVSLAYNESVVDNSYNLDRLICGFDGCLIIPFRRVSKTTKDGFNLAVKHVGNLGRFDYSLQAGYSQGEEKYKNEYWSNGDRLSRYRYDNDWTGENLDFAFYPSDRWRIGLGYRHNDTEGFDTEYYSVNLQWFVTPNIALDFGYSEAKPQEAEVYGFSIADFNQNNGSDVLASPDYAFYMPANSISPITIFDGNGAVFGLAAPISNGAVFGLAAPISLDEETVSVGLRIRF